MRNQRLVAFIHHYPPCQIGGAEISLHRNFADLTKLGYECTAVCFKNSNMMPFQSDNRFELDGVNVIQAKFPTTKTFLHNIIKSHDVVFTMLFAAPSFVGFSRECKKPVVNVVCDEMDFSSAEMFKSVKDSDLVIANSFYTQKRLSDSGVKSDVLYPRFYNRLTMGKSKRKHILYVNPNRHKGHEIIRKIATEFPEYSFVILGDVGYDVLAKKPVEKIKASNVEYLGFVNDESALNDLYKEAVVTLVPSQVPETFCMVAAESIFRGTPVIASNFGALPETIGQCGMLVDDFANPEAWKTALSIFLSQKSKYDFKSQKADLAKHSDSSILDKILQERL